MTVFPTASCNYHRFDPAWLSLCFNCCWLACEGKCASSWSPFGICEMRSERSVVGSQKESTRWSRKRSRNTRFQAGSNCWNGYQSWATPSPTSIKNYENDHPMPYHRIAPSHFAHGMTHGSLQLPIERSTSESLIVFLELQG